MVAIGKFRGLRGGKLFFFLFLFSPQELNKGKCFSSKYSKKQIMFPPLCVRWDCFRISEISSG